MFDQHPTLELLFDQLGLASDEVSMKTFIEQHQLPVGVMMHEADFWTDAQRNLLSSHWQKDDEWAIIVDTLNELLSHNVKDSG